MLTDAQANAVEAVANTAGKGIDAGRGLGGFLKDTVGSIPSDLLGTAGGDWLHEQRRRNLGRMRAKTERILEALDRSRITEPSASVVVPLLQIAADEKRKELQDLWAAMLANSMVDGGGKVRRAFFGVVAKMELLDARLLDIISHHQAQPGDANSHAIEAEIIEAGLPLDDVGLSLLALQQLDLIHGNLLFRSDAQTRVSLSVFGQGLMRACKVV